MYAARSASVSVEPGYGRSTSNIISTMISTHPDRIRLSVPSKSMTAKRGDFSSRNGRMISGMAWRVQVGGGWQSGRDHHAQSCSASPSPRLCGERGWGEGICPSSSTIADGDPALKVYRQSGSRVKDTHLTSRRSVSLVAIERKSPHDRHFASFQDDDWTEIGHVAVADFKPTAGSGVAFRARAMLSQ